MKMLVVSTFFAVLSSGVTAGSVAWPGARQVSGFHGPANVVLAANPTILKTVVPPQTKVFGFSTTQYINTVPSAVSLQPQVHQFPHFSYFPPVQHTTFYPVSGGSYFPSNVFYPPLAIAPAAPGYPGIPAAPAQDIPSFPQGTPVFPSQEVPNFPSQTAGDADTTVVDSADFPEQQTQDQPKEQSPSTEAPQQDKPTTPQTPPAGNFPSLPQAPSFPFLPQFPQSPQEGGAPSFPSFPQFPQGEPSFPSIPQFPQGSLPQFPQLPQLPLNPSFPQSPTPAPPTSFPAEAGGDKGLNDEDTVSVESA